LPDCDYSENGAYFVTICTKNRQHFLGAIKNQEMYLSQIGTIAHEYWLNIAKHFSYVHLDEFIVMPNHVHGIIIIDKDDEHRRNEALPRSYTGPYPYFSKISPKPDSLSSIVGAYKSAVSRQCHELGYKDFAWQSRFYDRVIRQEEGLETIQEYIKSNPINWGSDRNNLI
jgi:REP element-mobilizing transposase RayT